MDLRNLISLTKLYVRDKNGYMFTSDECKLFINQAIDRLLQHPLFKGMIHLDIPEDVPIILPPQYHYILALFAASRLYDIDERFFEGTQKRNEFEQIFNDLVTQVEEGSVQLTDGEGNPIELSETYSWFQDYVVDEYYGGTSTDDSEVL